MVPGTPPRRGALAALPPRHKPRRARWKIHARRLLRPPPRSPSSKIRAPLASPVLHGSPCEVHSPPRRRPRIVPSIDRRSSRPLLPPQSLASDPRRHLEADPTATLQYPTLKELSIIDRLGICPRLSPDCPPALRISALLQGSLMDTYGNINKLCAGSCS
ncbi:hypothetical protein PVAP13_4KG116700 [Panicum virgatum]|uniref:Uncharacterized protein n=1 Tax=Panicum virgatum TaxID=38727 RepID=A0A8T0TPD1_PANVG|nr:hypothetical protein PVAP13_4KG116700 [Panicum virgatum]